MPPTGTVEVVTPSTTTPGVDTLIGGTNGNSLGFIPLSEIRENKVALRGVHRESEGFRQLADSIKNNGVINPISVRFKDTGPDGVKDGKKYEIIDGLHRYTASLEVGMPNIPAQVMTKNDEDVLFTQIVGNVQRVETKAAEYSKGLLRILATRPAMTEAELANQLGKSPQWIAERLSLVNLTPENQVLVNDGKIGLANAYALAKLPVEEQPDWADRAQTQSTQEFSPAVSARVKQLRDLKRSGSEGTAETFIPVPILRSKADLVAQAEKGDELRALISRNNITKAIDAAQLALNWALQLDPQTVAARKSTYEAKKAADAEAKKARQAERELKKGIAPSTPAPAAAA